MAEKKSIKGLTAESVSVKLERREKSCRKVPKMPENKLDEKVLAMFVDRLIADKGGDTLDEKQKETLRGELREELDERMQRAMIKALPDEKLMKLEELLDADAPDEEIESFFANAGVSFDAPLRKAMSDFRDDYFTGKIKVSVKTTVMPKATAPVASEVPAPAQPAVSSPAASQPVQGTVSDVPGKSDVEGVADAVNASAQGAQTEPMTMPAAPVQTAGQVAGAQPAVQPVVPATQPAQPSTPTAQPVAPVVEPSVPVVEPSMPAVEPAVAQAPEAEKPLQEAPDLMAALNATGDANMTASANAAGNVNAAAGVNTTTTEAQPAAEVKPVADVNPEQVVEAPMNNTEATGKEA